MYINLYKYKKILKFKKKFNFTDFELITNYGLFSGDTNLLKTLTIFNLVQETSHLKGDIIELGINKGNKKYKYISIDKNRQPDVILKKIKS
jgi:hypothetical protein